MATKYRFVLTSTILLVFAVPSWSAIVPSGGEDRALPALAPMTLLLDSLEHWFPIDSQFPAPGRPSTGITQLTASPVVQFFTVGLNPAIDSSSRVPALSRVEEDEVISSIGAVPESSTLPFAGLGLFLIALSRLRSNSR